MTAWLDANCGADARAITPSGIRGVVNDALAIYFLDATMPSRWSANAASIARSTGSRLISSIRQPSPAPRSAVLMAMATAFVVPLVCDTEA
jgi:hypothetical protein